MPISCCAVGCTNRQLKGVQIPFYKIPTGKTLFEKKRRHLWLRAIKRDKWSLKEISNARICGAHFITGKRSDNPTAPNFTPSIFAYTVVDKSKDAVRVARFQRAARRSQDKEEQLLNSKKKTLHSEDISMTVNNDIDLPVNEVNRSVINDIEDVISDSECVIDGDGVTCEDSVLDLKKENINLKVVITTLKSENEDLLAEKHRLNQQIKSLEQEVANLASEKQSLHLKLEKNQTKFHFKYFEVNASKLNFFTGIGKIELFLWILRFCKLHGKLTVPNLSWEDHLLITLMKLRLGLLNIDLAHRFDVSPTKISNIFRDFVPLLAGIFSNFIVWPAKCVVRSNLPKCFKSKHQNVQCIIDCTEIFTERPSNLNARAQTWSNYKHHNTVKYLIGITPTGAISFLSSGWGGRVSDKEITVKSGFLDKIEMGDDILADRGFLVREELATRGAFLHIPAFTKGKKQLSGKEVDSSRALSRVRIHVERVIGQFKKFRFLQHVIPITQISMLDDITVICAGIINLGKPIVKK